MLVPSRTKYRKRQKGSREGLTKGGEFVEFGEFGIQSLGRGTITNRQIEACRIAITRYLSRRGKVWIKIFPDTPVTKKPAETRMGKGKGAVDSWVAVIKPGKVLFEVANVSREDAQKALVRAAAKIGIKTRFVDRVEKV